MIGYIYVYIVGHRRTSPFLKHSVFGRQCEDLQIQFALARGIDVGEEDTIDVLRQLIAKKWAEPILARNVCVPLMSKLESHIFTHTERCRPKPEHAKAIRTWILDDFKARVLNTTHTYGSIFWFLFHSHFLSTLGSLQTLLWFGNFIRNHGGINDYMYK